MRTANVVPSQMSAACATVGPQEFFLATNGGTVAARLAIPAGLFGTCDTVPVTVSPVAESTISSAISPVEPTRQALFGSFLTHEDMVVSTPVHVSAGIDGEAGGSKTEPLTKTASFSFRVDFLPYDAANPGHDASKDLCLAGFTNGQWECIDTQLVFVQTNVYKGNTQYLNGIFAVILNPVYIAGVGEVCPAPATTCPMTGPDAEAYVKANYVNEPDWQNNPNMCCGGPRKGGQIGNYPSCDTCPDIWRLYWWAFVIGLGVLVLIALITTYVLYRMSRYRNKWRAAKALMMADMGAESVVVFKEGLKNPGQFIPPNQDDGVIYDMNPMHNLDAMNDERLKLAEQQRLADEEAARNALNSKDAQIDALLKKEEAMKAQMRKLMQANQLHEDRAKKGRGGDVGKTGKKTQFEPTTA